MHTRAAARNLDGGVYCGMFTRAAVEFNIYYVDTERPATAESIILSPVWRRLCDSDDATNSLRSRPREEGKGKSGVNAITGDEDPGVFFIFPHFSSVCALVRLF